MVFVCVHGAGYSGLSYAAFGKSLVEKGEGKVGVLAYDARGHGESAPRQRSCERRADLPFAPAQARRGSRSSRRVKCWI